MGRPPIKKDGKSAKMVKSLAQYGIPQEDIAAVVGCSKPTLEKIYGAELAIGRALANAEIGKRLFEKALDGDTTALIFWAKCRMRWRTEESKKESDTAEKAGGVLITPGLLTETEWEAAAQRERERRMPDAAKRDKVGKQ